MHRIYCTEKWAAIKHIIPVLELLVLTNFLTHILCINIFYVIYMQFFLNNQNWLTDSKGVRAEDRTGNTYQSILARVIVQLRNLFIQKILTAQTYWSGTGSVKLIHFCFQSPSK